MSRLLPALASLVLISGACGLPPMISDTGYTGTWSRGNDRNVSIVSIARDGDAWRFRWTKRSFDGKLSILCDWDGRCEERLNGERVATYLIRTRFDSAEGKLYTDTIEERTIPQPVTLRYTDVMEVTDAGRTLWNYTVERDGRHFEGMSRPMRSFTKIADAVVHPPEPGTR